MNPNLPRNIEFHIPKVKDAQAAYDAHMQLEPPRPVPTDPRDAYAKRMKWLDRKEHLKAMLDMAKEAERSRWKSCQAPEKYAGMQAEAKPAEAPSRNHGGGQARKTAAERREKLASILGALAKVDPRGPDADRFRNLAAIERRNIRIAEEFEARATSER